MSDFDFLGSIGDVDTTSTFTPIPANKYLFRLYDLEIKRNKNDTRNYFNLKWKVEEGEFEGRFVWSILSIPVKPGSPDWQKTVAVEFKGNEAEMQEKQETIIQIFFQTLETITGQEWGDASKRPAIQPKSWIGNLVWGLVDVDEQYNNNKMKRIMPYDKDEDGSVLSGTTVTAKNSEAVVKQAQRIL